MSERNLIKRRIPVNRRERRRSENKASQQQLPSPSQSKGPEPRRHTRPTRAVLRRCYSEPAPRGISGGGGGVADYGGGDGEGRFRHLGMMGVSPPQEEVVFKRGKTCTDIFSAPENSLPRSPNKLFEQGYNKEAKVVVNVTVEGSPGPVRTMVKLGSSVEETIGLVIKKYGDEGRTPRLEKNAAFQLHNSYFSLESLERTGAIGNSGSRSFYLRKCPSELAVHKPEITPTSCTNPDIELQKTSTNTSGIMAATPPALAFIPCFLFREINKLIRKTRKLWKILGCITG